SKKAGGCSVGRVGRSTGRTTPPSHRAKSVPPPRLTKARKKFGRTKQAKRRAVQDGPAGNTNSNLNGTLDDPKVKKISAAFAEGLSGVLKERPDAVGVAVAVNGKIEEVNVYPNHQLLGKLYPRLLQSYALQATLEKDKAKDAKEVTCAAV